MKELGGYFELELQKGKEYHRDALALNTGRNALELIILYKNYSKIYIPFFTCDAILEPLIKNKVEYEFYPIDANFEPVFNFNHLKDNCAFLYTNYFGLKDIYVYELSKICKNLIVDSTLSFFSKPLASIPTFYSCRKFFGVPDGSYLYLDGFKSILEFKYDHSDNRLSHLLKRIEYGANYGYDFFKQNEDSLIGKPILQMSKLTKLLMCNVDYEYIKKKRTENFSLLHKHLFGINKLKLNIENLSIPMVYPLWVNQPELKEYLINHEIYIPTYWTNVLNWVSKKSLEYTLVNEIIYLPIDQRLEEEDLIRIVKLIQK